MAQKINSRVRALPAFQEGWISQESCTWKNALSLVCSSWQCVLWLVGDLWQSWGSPWRWRLKKGRCSTRINTNNYFFSHFSRAFSHAQSGLVLCISSVLVDVRAGTGHILSVNVSFWKCLLWILPCLQTLPFSWVLCWGSLVVCPCRWQPEHCDTTEENSAGRLSSEQKTLLGKAMQKRGKTRMLLSPQSLLALSKCVNCCSHT